MRVTNENEVTPLPEIPSSWKDVPSKVHINPRAVPNLASHASGGATGVLSHVGEQVSVDRAPPGQPPGTVPRFAITIRSDGFGVDVLDRLLLSLEPDVVPGTPLNGKIDKDNLMGHSVIDPSLSVGKRVHAQGTLSMRDPYPAHGIDPTEVSVEASSAPLASIHPKEKDGLVDFGDVASVRVNALGIAGAKGEIQGFIELQTHQRGARPVGPQR